jgi:hypothetical protein
MKLRMIMGLLLAGSLCVGTALQAQDAQDLTQKYLDAIDQVRDIAETAKTPRERRQAEQNLAEFESALEELENPKALPSSIRAVSVECNGNCCDNTLGQLCALAGTGRTPIAVDCKDVDDDDPIDIQCGGNGNNRCSVRTFSTSEPLCNYCSDSSGWDATVFCALP